MSHFASHGMERTRTPNHRHSAHCVRWSTFAALIALIAMAGMFSRAHAAGTPAGTLITNTATLSYSYGGVPGTPITSAPASVRVDELINVTLTWQDSAPVAVTTPDTNASISSGAKVGHCT